MPFQPGNRLSRGRPKRKYSVTTKLQDLLEKKVTIDENGEPQTNAQLIARWLLRCVVDGVDEVRDADNPARNELRILTPKERQDAAKLLLDRCEPPMKISADDQEIVEEVQDRCAALAHLTDVELEILAKVKT